MENTFKFIKTADLRTIWKEYVTDQILDKDYELVKDDESYAISEIKSYSDVRYNVDYELKKEDDERDSLLLTYIKNIIKYRIESRSQNVRDTTEKDYDDTMRMLELINKNKKDTTWLPRSITDENSVTSGYYSEPPRSYPY